MRETILIILAFIGSIFVLWFICCIVRGFNQARREQRAANKLNRYFQSVPVTIIEDHAVVPSFVVPSTETVLSEVAAEARARPVFNSQFSKAEMRELHSLNKDNMPSYSNPEAN